MSFQFPNYFVFYEFFYNLIPGFPLFFYGMEINKSQPGHSTAELAVAKRNSHSLGWGEMHSQLEVGGCWSGKWWKLHAWPDGGLRQDQSVYVIRGHPWFLCFGPKLQIWEQQIHCLHVQLFSDHHLLNNTPGQLLTWRSHCYQVL